MTAIPQEVLVSKIFPSSMQFSKFRSFLVWCHLELRYNQSGHILDVGFKLELRSHKVKVLILLCLQWLNFLPNLDSVGEEELRSKKTSCSQNSPLHGDLFHGVPSFGKGGQTWLKGLQLRKS